MKTQHLRIAAGILLALSCAQRGMAGETDLPAAVLAFDRANAEQASSNTNRFARPGVAANRETGEVRILAQATGVGVGDPIEFVLISPNSGHDYEAAAVAFASPSDVYGAMRFLGVSPGRPVDPKSLVFWPKGERVRVTVTGHSTNLWPGEIAAEKLIRNVKTGEAMNDSGFIFSGSKWIEEDSAPAYLPDLAEPHAIISLYNEPATVFDVPRLAPQNSLYDTLFPNPEFLPPTNALLEFALRPEPGKTVDLAMHVAPKNSNPVTLADVACFITPLPEGSGNGSLYPLTEAVKHFSQLTDDGKDVFVHAGFDDAMPVRLIQQVCAALNDIEGEMGIRIEPPPDGQLYYKAFIGDERHREREGRIQQPWELRLFEAQPGRTNFLTQINEHWRDNQIKPDLEPVNHPVAKPQDLRARLDELGPGLPVILVFATPALTHGTLMRFLGPVLSTHGIIHIYLEERPHKADAG